MRYQTKRRRTANHKRAHQRQIQRLIVDELLDNEKPQVDSDFAADGLFAAHDDYPTDTPSGEILDGESAEHES